MKTITSETCRRCHKRHGKVWRTSDAIWKKHHGKHEILCVNCFDELAGKRNLYWECAEGQYPSDLTDRAMGIIKGMSHTVDAVYRQVQKVGQLPDIAFVSETCITCEILFWVPRDFQANRLRDHMEYCCPLGHKQYYTGENREEKLKKQLAITKREYERCIQEKNEQIKQLQTAQLPETIGTR